MSRSRGAFFPFFWVVIVAFFFLFLYVIALFVTWIFGALIVNQINIVLETGDRGRTLSTLLLANTTEIAYMEMLGDTYAVNYRFHLLDEKDPKKVKDILELMLTEYYFTVGEKRPAIRFGEEFESLVQLTAQIPIPGVGKSGQLSSEVKLV